MHIFKQALITFLITLFLSSPLFAQKPIDNSDLQLGPFKVGNNFDMELSKKLLGRFEETKTSDSLKGIIKRFYFEDGIVWSINGKIVGVYSYAEASAKLMTPRGLNTGDLIEKAIKLYGKPSKTEKLVKGKLLHYSFINKNKTVSAATDKKGKIVFITVMDEI